MHFFKLSKFAATLANDQEVSFSHDQKVSFSLDQNYQLIKKQDDKTHH
jgi:hypothetical protein